MYIWYCGEDFLRWKHNRKHPFPGGGVEGISAVMSASPKRRPLSQCLFGFPISLVLTIPSPPPSLSLFLSYDLLFVPTEVLTHRPCQGCHWEDSVYACENNDDNAERYSLSLRPALRRLLRPLQPSAYSLEQQRRSKGARRLKMKGEKMPRFSPHFSTLRPELMFLINRHMCRTNNESKSNIVFFDSKKENDSESTVSWVMRLFQFSWVLELFLKFERREKKIFTIYTSKISLSAMNHQNIHAKWKAWCSVYLFHTEN